MRPWGSVHDKGEVWQFLPSITWPRCLRCPPNPKITVGTHVDGLSCFFGTLYPIYPGELRSPRTIGRTSPTGLYETRVPRTKSLALAVPEISGRTEQFLVCCTRSPTWIFVICPIEIDTLDSMWRCFKDFIRQSLRTWCIRFATGRFEFPAI